mmetsp:Transcript_4505/g.10606  ORF Transcript_4505/g.10606 Transcript_4505/m.10606 type:complete len:312 (-) Transcript_4505:182-1117(-)
MACLFKLVGLSLCTGVLSYGTSTRRACLASGIGLAGGVCSGASPVAAAPKLSISSRFETDDLPAPPVKQRSELNLFTSSSGLYDDLFFPSWMGGTWAVTLTLRSFSTPQGTRFLSGPQGNRPDVAAKTVADQQSRIGKAVGPYDLRWVTVNRPDGQVFVVEDRAFNTKARLDAFAGRDVVKRVEYVEIGGANRIGYGDAPLPTTLVRYKGGRAVQKTFSNNRASELDPATGLWTGFEFTRTLFAIADSDLPPVVTDTQVVTQLRQGPTPRSVTGRIRIADYLTPQDQLYFEARQRAVSVSDWEVSLTRIGD